MKNPIKFRSLKLFLLLVIYSLSLISLINAIDPNCKFTQVNLPGAVSDTTDSWTRNSPVLNIACDGYVTFFASMDNSGGAVYRVEDGGFQLVMGCDDELVNGAANQWGPRCTRYIGDREALICDRDGNFVAQLASEGLHCPISQMSKIPIKVKKGDKVRMWIDEPAGPFGYFTFTPIVCSSNSDCNDNNPSTEDKCLNPGKITSSCQHNLIRCSSNAGCGNSGFTGNMFCQGNGIFQNYNNFTCLNPGTINSSCINSVTAILKSNCSSGQICSNATCLTTQCSNGVDDDLDGLNDSQDPGCWNNINDPNTYNPILNNESRAGIACITNAQCGRDGYIGDKYCLDNKVYMNYKTFTCSNPALGGSSCTGVITKRPLQQCSDECLDGRCVNFTCSSNFDCNDNNLYTADECINPGTLNSSCNHATINCVNDNDCGIIGFFGLEFCSNNDVFKNFKTSKCLNPGTKQSSCQVVSVPTFLIDCGDNSCEDYGNNYCKNNQVYHKKLCNDKGCSNGSCLSTFREEETLVQNCMHGCLNGQCKPECSFNTDCLNGKTCLNNFCVQINCSSNTDCNDNNNNTEDICSNPGTILSSCAHTVVKCNSNLDCGNNVFLGQKTCQNGNVFDKYLVFICNNAATGISACVNYTEDRQISNCTSGCLNGECLGGQCNVDSDCHRDYASEKYCINNSVYENYHDYSCSVSNVCSENATTRLVETCDYKCRDGECRSKTSGASSLEEETTETTPLVILNKHGSDKSGINIIKSVNSSEGLNETTLKLGPNYAVSRDYDSWLLWIIGFIILLVIILIIVIAIILSKK